MGKPKKTPVEEEHPYEILRQGFKGSKKMVTKDGKVKKKILKQFTAYQCDVCYKKFDDKYNMSVHQKIHLNEAYSCDVCPYVGATKKYLARHKRSKHTAPRHQCSICGRAFHHPCGLKEHAMVHTGEKPLKCNICDKRFRVSFSLNSHMLIHKNEKPYKCSFCEYACRDSSTLRKHENRHMGIVRVFPCKICRKKFDSKPKLKYHIAEVHLDYLDVDVKKHACNYCGRAFKKLSQMKAHIDLVHENKERSCPVCGRRLKHERYLARHLRTHFPERPYSCTHRGCGAAFKDKTDLKKHAIIHFPHLHAACAQCGATFSRACRLRAHMRTHAPRAKSVTCDYCQVTFYTKNYLIKHIKQKHTGDKQRYICDHCGLVTFNKPSIVMHLKYGQCRKNELYCKICKTFYKKLEYLRSHYMKTHKMLYRPRKRKKKVERKPQIEVKVEPVEEADDPYREVQVSLLDVSKEEVEVEEEGAVENDLISYSKHVLSEDLQTYLLTDSAKDKPDSSFDQFLLKHVFQVKEEDPEPTLEKTDPDQETIVTQKIKNILQKAKEDETKKILEKKKKKQEKLLEKKLKREAKIMRRKKRRERFELERVRQIYNERMKKAASEASKKEPTKKIIYFQKKTSKGTAVEKKDDKASDSNEKETITTETITKESRNDQIGTKNVNSNENSRNGISNDTSETLNLPSDKNSEKDIDSTNSNITISDNNDIIISESNTERENDPKESEAKDIENCLSDIANTVKVKNININNEGDEGTYDIQKDINNDQIHTSNEVVERNVSKKCANNHNVINDTQDCENDDNIVINDENNAGNKGTGTDDSHNSKENYVDSQVLKNHNSDDLTSDIGNCNHAIEKYNCTINNNIDVNDKVKDLNNKKDDDISDDDVTDCEKSNDSDYEPDSENDSRPNKKMNFQTFQCYICFKLYPTKDELMQHCQFHFDICNSITLSKCPLCGHVESRNVARHMRDKHDINVSIRHKITTIDDAQGSRYGYKIADTVMEIIPSVKLLNHSAAVQIDKRKREMRDKTLEKTRLVKKGTEWIVEKYAHNVNYDEMPEFSEQELNQLPISESYVERLGQLSKLARKKGISILYPCNLCDKICQNFAALKLHGRRHDPDKKPFAPRKNKRNSKQVVDKPKVNSIANRTAKPQPIKNNHKCDKKLMKFYQTHIRGADIEFWQFLKIYNKMDRENVNDFVDLENRTDFGIHNYGDSSTPTESSKTVQQNDINAENAPKTNVNGNKRKIKKVVLQRKKIDKSQKLSSKLLQKSDSTTSKSNKKIVSSKKPYKRVLMISKRQQLERERKKDMLRENIKGTNLLK